MEGLVSCSLTMHCEIYSMNFIQNGNQNHSKIDFGANLVVILYEFILQILQCAIYALVVYQCSILQLELIIRALIHVNCLRMN